METEVSPVARIRVFALALSSALAAAPAAAEQPYPKVDFRGDWVLSDGKGTEVRAEMRFSADLMKMRIDMNQGGMEMTSVRGMPEGDVIMWSNQMPGMAMRLPSIRDEDFDAEMTGETRTVNGAACTVWKMATAEACLTDENIPLEVTSDAHRATLENVELTAQDPALFEIPAGLNVMDMPAGMSGGGPNPGQGLPF